MARPMPESVQIWNTTRSSRPGSFLTSIRCAKRNQKSTHTTLDFGRRQIRLKSTWRSTTTRMVRFTILASTSKQYYIKEIAPYVRKKRRLKSSAEIWVAFTVESPRQSIGRHARNADSATDGRGFVKG